MTSDTSNCRDYERQQRASMVMGIIVIGAALLATIYGVSTMAAVIANWAGVPLSR
ncbi:MAG TPA: hypothetical protein VHW00_06580 [Thermoanaerobaculia bacterium]|nr:hypothetical protein [Thermoanaerobaculia bacterium]